MTIVISIRRGDTEESRHKVTKTVFIIKCHFSMPERCFFISVIQLV